MKHYFDQATKVVGDLLKKESVTITVDQKATS
jgi:hypothetical protein